MIRPFPGLLIALLVLFLILALVVGGGKALRAAVLLPLVNGVIVPFLVAVFSSFIPEGLLLNVLVGEYGVLVKGIEWPFALILPYVFLFYIALSILEDSGYLPRLGVLVDGIMQKMGVQGDSVVPFIMGYGCAVPAILGTRAAASIKERVIIASMVAVAVPCVSQTGAFIALLGDRSVAVLLLVFFISLGAIFFTGYGLNRMIPGKSPPLVMEIPHLLMPDLQTIYKKVKLRLRHFVMDAQGPLLIGIFLAALLVETGGLTVISELLRPLVVTWLGLPPEASMALLLGVIRKELAVLPLLELNLSILQLLVASVVALFYLPCFAVLVVLMRELGLKIGLAISVFTIAIALLAGGIINQAGSYLALWL